MTKGCMNADDGPSGWVLIRRSSSGAAVAQSYRYTNFGKCKPLDCIYELSKDSFHCPTILHLLFLFFRHNISEPIEGDDLIKVNIIAAAAATAPAPEPEPVAIDHAAP